MFSQPRLYPAYQSLIPTLRSTLSLSLHSATFVPKFSLFNHHPTYLVVGSFTLARDKKNFFSNRIVILYSKIIHVSNDSVFASVSLKKKFRNNFSLSYHFPFSFFNFLFSFYLSSIFVPLVPKIFSSILFKILPQIPPRIPIVTLNSLNGTRLVTINLRFS